MAAAQRMFRTLFPCFKWTVYGFLGINVLVFLTQQTLLERTETLAWVFLLLLFDWETKQRETPYRSHWEQWLINGGRILAYGLVLHSAMGYGSAAHIAEYGALDLWNAQVWIAVLLLLECDVHAPGEYTPGEWHLRNSLKVLLYGALIVLALLPGLNGEWLHSYYALLWILCFFVIEINVLQIDQQLAFACDDSDEQPASREESGGSLRPSGGGW
jgi:hypothetical protein